jgi:hypothetical protein
MLQSESKSMVFLSWQNSFLHFEMVLSQGIAQEEKIK